MNKIKEIDKKIEENTEKKMTNLFKKVNLTALNLKQNFIENNSLIDENMKDKIEKHKDFSSYNLMNIKKFKYKNTIYGLVHVQLKYFIKKNNYDFYMKKIEETTDIAINISKKYSNDEKVFLFLDLSGITQKNFSRKFIKLIFNKLNLQYENKLELCFLYGNIKFIRLFWPFVKLFLDKETKEKIVLLN
tara:strand:- start:257 stop:823 length:567 start_codon:yes stop_codon:yes gene_type:complete